MHAVFLNPVGVVGGAERVLLASVFAFQQSSPKVKITVVLLGHGTLESRLLTSGIDVVVLPLPSCLSAMGDSQLRRGNRFWRLLELGFSSFLTLPLLLLYCRKIRGLLRGLDPDFIHSNGLKTHLLTAFTRPSGVPVVWHIHDYYSRRVVMAKALRRFQNRCAGAIAVSQSVREDAIGVFLELSICSIPNPVETEKFCPKVLDNAKLDGLAGLKPSIPETVRVGLISTYANWKGQDVFLKALAKLDPALSIRGYIIGGPIYTTAGSQFSLAELQAQAEHLGLKDRVGFIPFQADPVEIYRMLDVVVHASTRPEPFGLTIAEAMSCGRPVIVARAGGAAELFTDGHDAIGHLPGDAVDLAEKIELLIKNPSLRSTISVNARQTALVKFSPERFANDLVHFYTKVLAESSQKQGSRSRTMLVQNK